MGAFSLNDRMDLEPCCNHFPIPKFQCLLLEEGANAGMVRGKD